MLELRATAVRWWPGGQWTPIVGERPVTVAIAEGAVVDTSLARGARESLTPCAAGALCRPW